jgi:hypothetical protein
MLPFERMRLARFSLLLALGGIAVASSFAFERSASASVSIAVGFDALVKDADAVAIIVAQDAKSVWEDGRIVTYTRVKVEQGVAGDLGTGAEGWVRTLGGTVGRIGQLVDGEPNLSPTKPALVFLHKFKSTTTWEVSARAQGQFPIVADEATKTKKLLRAANVGVLLPPKATTAEAAGAGAAGPLQPQSPTSAGRAAAAAAAGPSSVKLASEILHERPLDEALREIATSFRRLHAPATK